MRLQDKVALVTGAGAGIGRESAELFAREGARVVCVDQNEETGEETVARIHFGGGMAHFVKADVSLEADAQRMIQAAVDEYGRLDVLFNNAGIVPNGTVEQCDVEEWDRCMAINVRSGFLGCKHALPVMREQGGGTIICTSSVAGVVGVKNRAAYSASKMAVIGLVKSVALDYVEQNIRINAICPGTVDTPSLQARLQATGDYEAARAQFVARQPMGRLGQATEIAALALYLASDESAYMTGSYLVIDGGLSL